MKRMSKRFIALLLIIVLLLSISITVFAGADDEEEPALTSKYENIDVNKLTGMGDDPAEISFAATAQYEEKEWYEYVVYSEKAVSSYKVNDTCRIIFFDPYDYNSSMIMDVTYDEHGWDTANSITISHTFSESMSFGKSDSVTDSRSVQVQDGEDQSGSTSESIGTSESVSDSHSYSHTDSSSDSDGDTDGHSETIGSDTAIKISGIGMDVTETIKISGTFSHSSSTNHTEGTSDTEGDNHTEGSVESNTNSETTGWSRVADRITVSTGSSTSTNSSWSMTESTSISKTYNAAYFNSSGAPLSWTIAYYEVKMPMRYELQLMANGEWATIEIGYCLLTTIEGACRAWRENTVTYYEHWGTGEPVADSDFWGDFFTEEKLIEAYKTRLYPD